MFADVGEDVVKPQKVDLSILLDIDDSPTPLRLLNILGVFQPQRHDERFLSVHSPGRR